MTDLINQFEEVRLVYRNKTKAIDRPKIKCPKDAFNIFYRNWDKDQISLFEESKLLLLDNQMRLMSIANISFGGMTEAIIDPRIVFSIALKRRAHRMILAHNHPSGTLEPSLADKKLTDMLVKIGNILRIPIEDHLIITEDGYCSVIDNQRGFVHE